MIALVGFENLLLHSRENVDFSLLTE